MLLYLFFNYLLSTCQKNWKLKNGPRLPTLPYYELPKPGETVTGDRY